MAKEKTVLDTVKESMATKFLEMCKDFPFTFKEVEIKEALAVDKETGKELVKEPLKGCYVYFTNKLMSCGEFGEEIKLLMVNNIVKENKDLDVVKEEEDIKASINITSILYKLLVNTMRLENETSKASVVRKLNGEARYISLEDMKVTVVSEEDFEKEEGEKTVLREEEFTLKEFLEILNIVLEDKKSNEIYL